MKIIRFMAENKEKYGVLENDVIFEIDGDIYGEFIKTFVNYNKKDVKILPPCKPSKIVAVGLNYSDHAEEFGEEIPNVPKIFLKPNTAVIGANDYIVIPKMSNRVEYEGELAIVIKKQAKDVEIADVNDYILGYTCLNDVTARDLQRLDGQWIRAKSFDTFAPIGECIETEVDADNCNIYTYLNGELKQKSNTKNFIFDIKYLVSFISQIMTLNQGDVITTGTPSGIGQIKSGDTVTIKIDGVGILENKVK